MFALFRLLARLTGAGLAGPASWPCGTRRPAPSTIANSVTTNDVTQAEDVNSWSYLALRDRAYAGSVGWDVRNLDTNAGRFHGVSVSTCDRGGVWFEGTAHLADALETLGTPGDVRQAARYLSDIRYAQVHGPNADGRGIIASSENGLTDCEATSSTPRCTLAPRPGTSWPPRRSTRCLTSRSSTSQSADPRTTGLTTRADNRYLLANR